MKLSELIKEYRAEHGLTVRAFADRCGVSHPTIIYLERGYGSRNEEKNIPKIQQLQKLADGMGMSLEELMYQCDDLPGIKKPIQADELSEVKRQFIESVADLSDDQVKRLQGIVDMVKGSDPQ